MSDAELKANEKLDHVCGLQGFDKMEGDECKACAFDLISQINTLSGDK